MPASGKQDAVLRRATTEISELEAGPSECSGEQGGTGPVATENANPNDGNHSYCDARNQNEDFKPHPEKGTNHEHKKHQHWHRSGSNHAAMLLINNLLRAFRSEYRILPAI